MNRDTDLEQAPKIVVKRADFDDQDGVARCALLLRRAIRTHDALPDRYRQRVWPDYLQSSADAYGYNDAKPPKFRPSPKDVSNLLPVMGWLVWIREQNNGERDFKIIMGRARNIAWWRLAQRYGRSERQVQRWYDGAVAAIYGHFKRDVWDLEPG